MKKKFLIAAMMALSIPAMAEADTYTAKVMSSTPIHQTIAGQECFQVPVQQSQGSQSTLNAGTVLGGIAGALLGAQVGQGNGKVAAGALGAVGGALAGNSINQGQQQGGTRQECHDVQKQVVSGYQVEFMLGGKYKGSATVPSAPSAPGDTIQVSIVPAH